MSDKVWVKGYYRKKKKKGKGEPGGCLSSLVGLVMVILLIGAVIHGCSGHDDSKSVVTGKPGDNSSIN